MVLSGWLGAISAALALVLVVAFGVLADLSFESLNEMMKTVGIASDYYLTKLILESRVREFILKKIHNLSENIDLLLTVLIACLVIITIYLMYCFYANVSLIIGTKNVRFVTVISN